MTGIVNYVPPVTWILAQGFRELSLGFAGERVMKEGGGEMLFEPHIMIARGKRSVWSAGEEAVSCEDWIIVRVSER